MKALTSRSDRADLNLYCPGCGFEVAECVNPDGTLHDLRARDIVICEHCTLASHVSPTLRGWLRLIEITQAQFDRMPPAMQLGLRKAIYAIEAARQPQTTSESGDADRL